MLQKSKAHGRRPVGLTYWYAKKRRSDGKGDITFSYPVKDFTGQRFRSSLTWKD
jgi:hypothetical protein